MKTLVRLLYIVITLVVLVIVIAFFMPKKMEIERSIVIHAKPETVFNHVNNLRNWDLWSPWNRLDPEMVITYGDSWKGENASYDWVSDMPEVGEGSLKITESITNETIRTRLDFKDWGGANAAMAFEPISEGVKVTWGFESDRIGLISRWFYLLMDIRSSLENDYDKGLEALKSISETMDITVDIDWVDEFEALTTDTEGKPENISMLLAEGYGKITKAIEENNAAQAGNVFAIYHEYTDEKVVIEPGLPVDKEIPSSEEVHFKTIPAHKAIIAHHYGPYHELSTTYQALEGLMKKYGLEKDGPVWDIYVTDPGLEKDPTKWLTKICFPVK